MYKNTYKYTSMKSKKLCGMIKPDKNELKNGK